MTLMWCRPGNPRARSAGAAVCHNIVPRGGRPNDHQFSGPVGGAGIRWIGLALERLKNEVVQAIGTLIQTGSWWWWSS